MRVLIAVDMEGISGVVHWDHVKPGHFEYDRFRQIMTEEVNAAIDGALDGGATSVIVTDGHNNGHNILIEKLHAPARLNSGSPAPLSTGRTATWNMPRCDGNTCRGVAACSTSSGSGPAPATTPSRST